MRCVALFCSPVCSLSLFAVLNRSRGSELESGKLVALSTPELFCWLSVVAVHSTTLCPWSCAQQLPLCAFACTRHYLPHHTHIRTSFLSFSLTLSLYLPHYYVMFFCVCSVPQAPRPCHPTLLTESPTLHIFILRMISTRKSMLLCGLALLCTLLLVTPAVEASYFVREMDRIRTATASAYIQRVSNQKNVSKLPSGLLFNVLRRGWGDVAPSMDDVCEVHYTIDFRFPKTLETSRQNPYPVHRKPSDFIPGIQEMMQYMREGDRWYAYIPYQLAYGAAGNEEKGVMSFANLRCDLEILKCNSPSGMKSAEIDAQLKQYMKVPMPAKTAKPDFEKVPKNQ